MSCDLRIVRVCFLAARNVFSLILRIIYPLPDSFYVQFSIFLYQNQTIKSNIGVEHFTPTEPMHFRVDKDALQVMCEACVSPQ